MHGHIPAQDPETIDRDTISASVQVLRRHALVLAVAFVGGGAVGYGISHAVSPTYVSSTLFVPPQQQGGTSAALASLGALSNLVGNSVNLKSSEDQYISMMQSVTVSDRVIKRFDLVKVYETEYQDATRRKLAKRVQITAGKKDGMIRVEVEDADPRRAADMANDYVDELRTLTSHIAVTEAQQRALFFQHLLDETRQKLVASQTALESSGITAGTLKTEPRTAANGYASLQAELTAAQVKLQILLSTLADSAPEVVQQKAAVTALSSQVARLENSQSMANGSPDYIGKYRDFKYQETLFDLYSRQFELARIDESREGSLIQVIDTASPAEHKHSPQRAVYAVLGAMLATLAAAVVLLRRAQRKSA